MLGTISPSGKEVGPFLSIEQASLPQTTPPERRTSTFAAYNLVASLAGALGALAVGLPEALGLEALAGYRTRPTAKYDGVILETETAVDAASFAPHAAQMAKWTDEFG